MGNCFVIFVFFLYIAQSLLGAKKTCASLVEAGGFVAAICLVVLIFFHYIARFFRGLEKIGWAIT